MGTIIGIGVVIVVGFIWLMVSSNMSNKASTKHEEIFKKILSDKGLTPDQILFTSHNDSKNCLSVNEYNAKISFGYVKDNKLETKEYSFNDVVSFEIQVDDKSSRKVSVGGALVGAALAGGVGALIGSQSGKNKTKVRSMNIVITVNIISDPIIKFSILTPSPDGKGWDSESSVVSHAVERAEKWTGIFNIILKHQTS